MPYKVKLTRTVDLEEYLQEKTSEVMHALDGIEWLKDEAIVKAASAMSEISEFVDQIKQRIGDLEPEDEDCVFEKDYENKTVHEMGVASGRV